MRYVQFLGSWETIGKQITPSAAALWRGLNFENLRDMGQANVIPAPNLCVWEAVAEDACVALLEADPTHYTVLLDESADVKMDKRPDAKIEKPRDEKPDQTSKNKLELFLKQKGVRDADAAALSKKADANATRAAIVANVVAYCNALPLAKGVK